MAFRSGVYGTVFMLQCNDYQLVVFNVQENVMKCRLQLDVCWGVCKHQKRNPPPVVPYVYHNLVGFAHARIHRWDAQYQLHHPALQCVIS